ncbi:MAG: ADP-ribosylglycohydrolase family protein [Chloroflexia bacterium]|nr:ADP-ribosylglycohydrolase family protein [Chloroflexia bacterium]
MMASDSLIDRYVGCLLGLACGDALGGAVEFESREMIGARYPAGVRDMVGGGPWDLRPGETTDDTAMALALARACDAEHLDMTAVTEHFLRWYRSDPKDIGTTTRAALALLANGVPWDEAGERVNRQTPGGAAGNGAVMRCAPVALRFRMEPDRLRRASLDTARITHADTRAAWGTVALNQVIVHLLNEGTLDGVVEAATAGIEESLVVAAVTSVPTLTEDDLASGGYVLATLTAALWCLLNQPNAEEAIVTAVGLGRDTDTTGAVTGALVGAAYGVRALPERWLALVEHRAELTDLAGRLLRRGSQTTSNTESA